METLANWAAFRNHARVVGEAALRLRQSLFFTLSSQFPCYRKSVTRVSLKWFCGAAKTPDLELRVCAIHPYFEPALLLDFCF